VAHPKSVNTWPAYHDVAGPAGTRCSNSSESTAQLSRHCQASPAASVSAMIVSVSTNDTLKCSFHPLTPLSYSTSQPSMHPISGSLKPQMSLCSPLAAADPSLPPHLLVAQFSTTLSPCNTSTVTKLKQNTGRGQAQAESSGDFWAEQNPFWDRPGRKRRAVADRPIDQANA
jgi:hypothetical protein